MRLQIFNYAFNVPLSVGVVLAGFNPLANEVYHG